MLEIILFQIEIDDIQKFIYTDTIISGIKIEHVIIGTDAGGIRTMITQMNTRVTYM